MLNQELLDYINQAKAAGQTDEQIKVALRTVGWQEKDIDDSFKSLLVSPRIQPNKPMNKTYLVILLAVAGILVIAGLSYGAYYYWSNTQDKGIACSMEVKLCSDGSSVGRTGPNCEFAACSSVSASPSPSLSTVADETVGWQTYKNEKYGFEIKYPKGWKVYLAKEGVSNSNFLFSLQLSKGEEIFYNLLVKEDTYENGKIWSEIKNISENEVQEYSINNDIKAYRIILLTDMQNSQYTIYTICANAPYIFEFQINVTPDQADQEILKETEQILSTLKFFQPFPVIISLK